MTTDRPRARTMVIKRSDWMLNVLVAGGWLLLVASVGILLTPHTVALAHGGHGKTAITWIVICAINALSAWQTRSKKVSLSAAAIAIQRPITDGGSSGNQTQRFTAIRQRAFGLVYRNGPYRPAISSGPSSQGRRSERHIRAGSAHGLAYTSLGSDSYRYGGMRPGAARGRTD